MKLIVKYNLIFTMFSKVNWRNGAVVLPFLLQAFLSLSIKKYDKGFSGIVFIP